MKYVVSGRKISWLSLVLIGALCLSACGEVSEPQPQEVQTQTQTQAMTESAEHYQQDLYQQWWTGDHGYFQRTLADGAKFHATNGIKYGPDGNLYVASVLSRAIFVVDPNTGDVLDRIGTEEGVESPDDLTFGPDGSLYWTSFLTGEVGRLSPAGVKTTVAQLAPGVNAIAMSPDGRLFVTRVFMGDELYELDPEGVEPPRLVASGLMGLNSMEFGADGFLYGPQWFAGTVARINVDTGEVTTVLDGLGVPAAVKFDSNGILHVVDQERGQVVALNLATGESEVVVQVPEAGADNLAFDAQDNIYLTNAHDGWVRKVLPDGSIISLVEEGMVAPGGVAVLPYGHGESVFVADALSLKAFDSIFGWKTVEAHAIIGVSPLAAPISATNDNGRLLTTSWFANVVQVWDPAVHTVVESHRDFAVPLNAVRYQGDLVVAELATHRVVRRPAGTTDKLPMAGVPVPTGLATDGDSLWVADWATGRVLLIADNGQTLPAPQLVASGLSFPEGMTVDSDGTLLVVETGADQLTRIDPATGAKTVVADDLEVGLAGPPGMPPTYIFNGVAADECGTIYLTVDSKNTIEKFTPLSFDAWRCRWLSRL
jgi:sugar lactone lactonase YvrE